MKRVMNSKEYVENLGSECPYCGSTQLVGGTVEVHHARAYQPIDCVDCKRSWVDVYKLIGYSEN